MTDYAELAKALRLCANYECGQCLYDRIGSDCSIKLANDAANAIETLLATRTDELNNAWKQGYDAAGGKA